MPSLQEKFRNTTFKRRHFQSSYWKKHLLSLLGEEIDTINGIYKVAKSKSGLTAPIYVKKSFKLQAFNSSISVCIRVWLLPQSIKNK